MKQVISIIDDHQYHDTNCFQHQLGIALQRESNHTNVSLNDILHGRNTDWKRADVVISRLKLRTLFRVRNDLAKVLGQCPITVYDQDPWESFRDDSPLKGAYESISNALNVTTFAVTSEWWKDLILSKGIRSTFVKMWLLPEYCGFSLPFNERPYDIGFVGTVHPRRRRLIENLRDMGLEVHVEPGGYGYQPFLQALEKFKVFIHTEDLPLTVDGTEANIGTGLWVKDIEAAARGCYSIRDAKPGAESYHFDTINTIKLFDSIDDIPLILDEIKSQKSQQELINDSVNTIQKLNCWRETATHLTQVTL